MADDIPSTSEGLLNAALWGGATAAAIVHPELAVGTGAAAGYLSTYSEQVVAQVRDALSGIFRRRVDRAVRVLVDAANRADLDLGELMRRIEADPTREQLLLRTLEAAAGTAMEDWLPLYAVALANGTVDQNVGTASWETMFVRVLDDLDGAHLQMLDLFTRSANELGMGDGGPDFDNPVQYLNERGLDLAAAHLPNHSALMAVLERHGLVTRTPPGGGMSMSVGPGIISWRLTDFGRQFHGRLIDVGTLLTPQRPAPPPE